MAEAGLATAADSVTPRVYRVLRRIKETPDVATLQLAPVDGGPAMTFAAGQFNMLYLPGFGEAAISISHCLTDATLPLQHTIRAVGPLTRKLCALGRGDAVGVRGPFGRGWPVDQLAGSDVLVLAGGIGLAPLRPAVHQLLAHRQAYGRLALLYGSRSPDDVLFAAELSRLRQRLDLQLEVTVDNARSSWHGHVGVVTQLLRRVAFDPAQTSALICGPEIMIRVCARELARLGVAREQLFVSLERHMQCGIGLCGHCQLGPFFLCKDGPVLPYASVEPLLAVRGL